MADGGAWTNGGIFALVVVVATAVYKGISGAWPLVRSIWKAKTERRDGEVKRSETIIDLAQRQTVGWGELMKEDNVRLRQENVGLRAEIAVVRADLRTANDKIDTLEDTITDLTRRLARLETNGNS